MSEKLKSLTLEDCVGLSNLVGTSLWEEKTTDTKYTAFYRGFEIELQSINPTNRCGSYFGYSISVSFGPLMTASYTAYHDHVELFVYASEKERKALTEEIDETANESYRAVRGAFNRVHSGVKKQKYLEQSNWSRRTRKEGILLARRLLRR